MKMALSSVPGTSFSGSGFFKKMLKKKAKCNMFTVVLIDLHFQYKYFIFFTLLAGCQIHNEFRCV